MKTSKFKAQVRWVAHYDDKTIACISRSRAEARQWCPSGGTTTRVAMIPLDDPEALVGAAAEAYFQAWHSDSATRREAMRAALTAIGVLPRQKKGRK